MSAPPSPLISPSELAAAMLASGVDVIDASVELPSPRFDGDHRHASGLAGWIEEQIPGSRHVDLLHAFSDPHARFSFAMPAWSAWPDRLDTLGFHPDRMPVIYDRSDGFWAARLWWMLDSAGIRCRVLDGGIAAWKADGQMISRGAPRRPPRVCRHDWSLRPQPQRWADLEQVRAIAEGLQQGTLICALSDAMFNGTVPTRYSRRGHIPGSLNLPARRLLGPANRRRPMAENAELVAASLANAATPWVIYCGGGISAASLALDLYRLGHRDVAVYDGSLQEWSADVSLPMSSAT